MIYQTLDIKEIEAKYNSFGFVAFSKLFIRVLFELILLNFALSPFVVLVLTLIVGYGLPDLIHRNIFFAIWLLSEVVIFISLLYIAVRNELESKYSWLSQYKDKISSWYKFEHRMLKEDIEIKEKKLKDKEQILRTLIYSNRPFGATSKMRADVEMMIFDESAKYLSSKRGPAPVAAAEVKRMKRISSEIFRQSKEMEYKLEYLYNIFPDIRSYMEKDEDLLALTEVLSYNELEESRDKRMDYLSQEEYSKLSDTERSQLALDRYINSRNKSKWQIGRDYEMSCAFQLREKNYNVEMHGIKYGYDDLGRDLIAIDPTSTRTLIIQCKNWSSERVLHENIVMQLYGTTILYQIDNNMFKDDIIPVLMIPTYSKISEVATKFAKRLGVRIIRMDYKEFPRIKCNINNGEKIYHLPFDQQYDRTEIKNIGECYCITVQEAVNKGFRRAKRHFIKQLV